MKHNNPEHKGPVESRSDNQSTITICHTDDVAAVPAELLEHQRKPATIEGTTYFSGGAYELGELYTLGETAEAIAQEVAVTLESIGWSSMVGTPLLEVAKKGTLHMAPQEHGCLRNQTKRISRLLHEAEQRWQELHGGDPTPAARKA